jgi:hypothetical protein
MERIESLFGAEAREFFERQQAVRRRMQFEPGRVQEVFLAEGSSEVEVVEEIEEGVGVEIEEATEASAVAADPLAEPEPEPAAATQPAPVTLVPFQLRVLVGDPDNTFALRLGENTLGRADGNDIQLRNNTVSGAHAVVAAVGGRITIRDTDSSNGTKVNDHRISEPTELTPGDQITLGDVTLVFESAGGGGVSD